MIRKAVIVVLTLGAVGTFVGWFVTIRWSVVYTRGFVQVRLVEGSLSMQHWIILAAPTPRYRKVG